VISQKTAFFIVTAVKTSNLTLMVISVWFHDDWRRGGVRDWFGREGRTVMRAVIFSFCS
jgi:hypothetical protein